MITLTASLDLHSFLPPYRSLLSPNSRYDYRTHSLVPVGPHDLPPVQPPPAKNKSKIKMKYKSLLGDVSRRTSILSMRMGSHELLLAAALHRSLLAVAMPLQLRHLPVEILERVWGYIDDDDYKCCLLVSRQFYQLTKPFFYRLLSFTSTYKLAQFVTYLRLNSEVGVYVCEIDLSGLKPSNFGIAEEDEGGELDNGAARAAAPTEGNDADNFAVAADATDAAGGDGPVARANPAPGATVHSTPGTNVTLLTPMAHPLAGWRDWKFQSNPIYSLHPGLTKTHSQLLAVLALLTVLPQARSVRSSYLVRLAPRSASSASIHAAANKMHKLSRYFRKRLHSTLGSEGKRAPSAPSHRRNALLLLHALHILLLLQLLQLLQLLLLRRLVPHAHPPMNKLLYSYLGLKDVPIGYILHILRLCPNLAIINLANLLLLVDHEINHKMAYKYQTYDLMHNYPKDLSGTVHRLMLAGLAPGSSLALLRRGELMRAAAWTSSSGGGRAAAGSLALSVYLLHAPTRPRYNSLLPPLAAHKADWLYGAKGDGVVYLLDLNLKAINSNYLERVLERQILTTIARVHLDRICHTLQYLNLASMIWLTKLLVQELLRDFLEDTPCAMSDDDDNDGDSLLASLLSLDRCCGHRQQQLVVDLTNLGMYKNLLWARRIDLGLPQGLRLATRIVRDELMDTHEYHTRRSQVRRGRIGENYFS